MKNAVSYLFLVFILGACSPAKEKTSSSQAEAIDQQTIRKIDVHAHYRYPRPYLPSFFQDWNMQAVLVDVAHEDTSGIDRSWEQYVDMNIENPEVFYLCSSLVGAGIDDPYFAAKNIERLKNEIATGAKMVKVWKNFGMVTKDAAGNFIQIDDARLQPVWDFLKEKGIPVMAHIGEPVQAWRPLDNPMNPHYEYYKNNPQYHAFAHPEIPSYETIIAARDRWIEANPDLPILCAHMGSMSHSVDMVAERLDKYPNIMVEPAARFGDLASQNSDKVKAFYVKYQDRIMFGTDFGNYDPAEGWTAEQLDAEQKDLNATYNDLWRYLSTTDSLVIRKQHTRGLGLPREVLEKVYFQNASNFLGLE
ncbi:MAG: amidohydrolase family protein [Imperialibacter sp.]|uniref:amidohydrolase family protein n=1 Tax=Imperialibacter sp. TaxID=2038411 RepID=UPI0030D74644